MKENLLVTLADKNYIDQAKQLFSSVYWNAGWKGDYMLLAHEIPEKDLKWFRDKGILIKKCKPLYNKPIGDGNYPPVVLDKFYLFTPEFKKWKHVIFLDADIIVRASLDKLTNTKAFSSLKILNKDFRSYFSLRDSNEIFLLKKEYNLIRPTFNSAVIAFDTNIIKEDTFNKLIILFKKYKKIINGDDPILNLFFYNLWINTPLVFNLRVNHIVFKKVDSIVLHFERPFRTDNKEKNNPWNLQNPFYNEWKNNLARSEFIDLNKIPQGKKWSSFKIWRYSSYLSIKMFLCNLNKRIYQEILILKKKIAPLKKKIASGMKYVIGTPDRIMGKMGILMKRYNPNLYYKLKKIKDMN